MKITLLGHQDIASLYALDSLVKLVPGHEYSMFWSGPATAARQPGAELEALAAWDRQLFDRYIERPATCSVFGRASILSAPNSADGLGQLQATAPDLVVSIRYRRILKDAAIGIPRHGVLNLHSGVLPAYRGVMATFWAMLAGEREIGTTLHRIVDGGIDTGPIIAIERQAADYSRSYLANVLALYEAGCSNIAQAIEKLDQSGELTAIEQPSGEGKYHGPPNESDALNFVNSGLVLFNGTETL